MAAVGDAATHNEKEVKTRYPVVEGLIAGSTKLEGRIKRLVAEEKSFLTRRDLVGL